MPKIKETMESTAAAIPFAERNLPEDAIDIMNQVQVDGKRPVATKRKDTRPRARAK